MAANGIQIEISADDKATPTINSVNGSLQGLSNTSHSVSTNADGMNLSLLDAVGGVKGLGFALSIVTTGIGVFAAALEFSEQAASIDRLTEAGEEMASQYGGNMDEIIAKVKEASNGTVSEMNIISASNKAMMLGLGADADQLANLMEVAAFRGRAMGVSTTQAFDDIVRGIGRASPMILDNLGIIIDADSTYESYAKSIGKSKDELTKAEKTQALLNATLATGNEMLSKAGGLAEDNASAFERWDAELENTKNSLLENTLEMSRLADMGADALVSIQNLSENGFGYGEGKLNAWSLFVDIATSRVSKHKEENMAAADAVAAHGDRLDETTAAVANMGAATALTTQEINAMTKANNEQMSLIKKLDNIQKDYNTSLAEMTAEFGAGSQEVKNLQADHQSALNSIAYDLYLARLAVDGFTDAERIAAEKAGVAMGIISQEAVDLSYKFIDNADKVGTFGTTAQSSFMTAKESAMDAKSEAVAYGQSIAEASVDREVTVTFHGVTTGNGWDVVNTGSGCFTRGTKVLMDTNTYQSIEDVLIGDFVKSYDVDNGVFVSAKVTNTFVHIVNKLVVINGIETTPEHPFYANGQWIKAGALKIGDVIFLESDEFAEVTTINTREETTTVYNIEVENTHNYFAGGVLVHNKEAQLAPHGAMSSPYAAQQTTQTFDYQMFAVVLRDVLSQFFK